MRDFLLECCERLDRKDFSCTGIDRAATGKRPVTLSLCQCFHCCRHRRSSINEIRLLQMRFTAVQRARLSVSRDDEAQGHLSGGHAQPRELLLRQAVSHAIHEARPRAKVQSCLRSEQILASPLALLVFRDSLVRCLSEINSNCCCYFFYVFLRK